MNPIPAAGTEAAVPQVEAASGATAGGGTAAASAGGSAPQAPPSATSAHEAAASAAEAASRHSRRLGDKKAAARAAARAVAAAERAAGSDLAGDRQDRLQRAAALARGRQARAARRERAAEGLVTELPAVPTAAGGAARRSQAAGAPRAAAKPSKAAAQAPRAAKAPRAVAKAFRAATGATSQKGRRRKAAAAPAHGEADAARRMGTCAAAPAAGTSQGEIATEGAPAGQSLLAANVQSGGSDGTGAAQRGAKPRTGKPGHGGGAGEAACVLFSPAKIVQLSAANRNPSSPRIVLLPGVFALLQGQVSSALLNNCQPKKELHKTFGSPYGRQMF